MPSLGYNKLIIRYFFQSDFIKIYVKHCYEVISKLNLKGYPQKPVCTELDCEISETTQDQ